MFRRRRLLDGGSAAAIVAAYSGSALALDWINNTYIGTTSNLIRQNETLGGSFSGITWITTRATVTNGATANPITGATTASLLTEDSTAANSHYTNGQLTKIAANIPYTFSFYVKANGRTKCWAWITASSQANLASAHYDLSTVTTNTVITQGTGVTNSGATITDVGSGWYRCTLSAISNTDTTIQFLIGTSTSAGSIGHNGDNTSGLYLYGLQMEPRACASALISTARRNLLLHSEGVLSTYPTTYGCADTTTVSGFTSSIYFGDNSDNRYAYKVYTLSAGTYTLSAYVEMTDGGAPVPGVTNSLGDFSLIIGGQYASSYTTTFISGTTYRVSGTFAWTSGITNNGVIKNTTQSARTFKVTGLQLEVAASASEYQKVTDGSYSSTVTASSYDMLPGWYYTRTGVAYAETTKAVRINHLTYSAALDNAIWTKTNTTVTRNAAIAPDGTNTAFMLTDGGSEVFYQNTTAAIYSNTVTGSAYVKRGNSDTAYATFGLRDYDAGVTHLSFGVNLTTGVITYTTGSTGGLVTDVGNGWWRVSFTVTAWTPGGRCRFYCGAASNVGATSDYTYMWGPQLEYGSVATDYIPTHSVARAICDGGTVSKYLQAYPASCARVTSNGILIEEARTNLLLRSQEFDNASWTNGATVSANASTAPDGTLTADRMTSAGSPACSQAVVLAALSCTLTCYVKKGSAANQANRFGIRNDTTATDLVFVRIDLDTGAITYTTGASGASATAMGNGWWRVVISVSAGITSGDSIRSYIGFVGAATSGQYSDFWGAQLEVGAFPTSYIPTTTASATRAADVPLISSLTVNGTEGTLVTEALADATPTASANYVAIITAASTNDSVSVLRNSTPQVRAQVYGNASARFNVLNTSWPNNTVAKVGNSYKAGDYKACFNGGAVATGADATTPVFANLPDRMYIGCLTTASQINGYVRRVVYYPRAFSSAELQAATA